MSMRDKIEHAIQNQPCTVKELKQKFGGERGADRKVMEALDELVREAVVCQRQGVFFTVRSGRADKALLCKVVKLGKNFAFVMLEDGTSDIFIPGRFTKGAMPGDDVLVEKFEHPRVEGSDEGAILAILTEKNDLVGTVRRVEGRLRFVPDDCPAITMPLARDCEGGAKDGDKVAVEILNRGSRQEDHRVGVAMRFGSSDEAKRCAKALLYAKDIRTRFPDKVRDEAKKFEGAEVSEKDCEDILSGLASIADDLASGALTIDPNAEDVHTFVEQTLTARIGDAGKRLHTGRSRNDQVALDIRLTLRDYSHTLQAYIVELVKVICRKAAENTTAVMPGYTHLQRAQPITFGHALMAYAWMLLRDLQRFEDATARMDAQCPLGSGALAGTTYPLDRQFTAEKLGFAAPCPNSLDGVSDRDFCIELANAISICMMHLSRLSEEIILWCSWEFKFIELDDAFTTGSSIMPQKKNPDVTELIRGKTGRVYGDLNTLLVMMKGIPLAYNKDMQEDKEAIFDAVDTLELCLKTVTPMLDTMKTLPANMRRAAAKGFINATDCADYLTKKGMPFRDAYKLTGCMVSDCISKDKTLEELTLDEFKGYSALFENDIYDAIDLIKCCEGRTSYGGPSEASVKKQIELAGAQLGGWEAANA